MALTAPADFHSPLEFEHGDRRASRRRNSESCVVFSAFMLGMVVATLGFFTVERYGLADSSLMKFFFAPAVPPRRSVTGAAGASPHSHGSFKSLTIASESERTKPQQMVLAPRYEPKWKKKKTLAEVQGDIDPIDKGITGTIPIVFQCGDSSISAMANPGDSIRDVAFQAGQYIRYGCGKGECGTCQAKVGGKWIKPCVAVVPGDIAKGDSLVIEVRDVKNKAKGSGKFYSVRSFCMGFYNNLLGMAGFVKRGGAAKKNYDERMEYEDLIAKKTAEKKAAKAARGKDYLVDVPEIVPTPH